MKAYMVLFDGAGWEFVDGLESTIFLQREDAERKLEEVRQSHIQQCKEKGWDSYAHRYDIEQFDLVGSWVDV
jgi:hypothetical protein